MGNILTRIACGLVSGAVSALTIGMLFKLHKKIK